MIASLTLTHLGPAVDDITFAIDNPQGLTDIRLPSETGKSTFTEGLIFALQGTDSLGKPFPADLISDGHQKGTATVRTAGRRKLVVSQSINRGKDGRARRITRFTGVDGEEPIQSKTEQSHADAINAGISGLGRRTTIARLIMAPMAWVSLMDGKLDGQDLRDALVDLAQIDTAQLRQAVARLMAPHALYQDDPIDVAGAMSAAKLAGQRTQRAEGSVRTRAEVVAEAEIAATADAGPTADELAEAESTIANRDAWTERDRKTQQWSDATGSRTAALSRAKDWQGRRDALGERPDGHGDQIERARDAKTTATEAREEAEQTQSDAGRMFRAAERALSDEQGRSDGVVDDAAQVLLDAEQDAAISRKRADDLPDADECPTCGRDGWEKAADERERINREADDDATLAGSARKSYDDAKRTEPGRFKARLAEPTKALEQARKTMDAAQVQLDKATANLAAKQTAYEQALSLGGDAAAWDASLQALGIEPTIPAAPGKAPQEPASDRPTPQSIEDARAVIRRGREATGARGARVEGVDEAKANLTQARAALATAEQEVRRLQALVAAARGAPSEALRAWLPALEVGGITIRLRGSGVELIVDGHSWRFVSSGRQVVADFEFRAAIRKEDGRRFLPIVVDNCQAWSGEWPEIGGPVIRLWTAK